MAVDLLFRGRVLSILQARGQALANDTSDYQIQANGDEITLSVWNVAKLGAAPTAAQIAAVTDAQANAAVAAQARLEAQSVIDNMPIVQKAILLAIIDQMNVIRSKFTPPMQPITVVQAITAVRDKAGTL